MSNAGMVLFSLAFITVAVFFGNYYSKMHISKEIWMAVTIVTVVLFAAEYLYNAFVKKNNKEEI